MFDTITIDRRKRTANTAAVVFVVALATLLAISLAGSALAAENASSLKGEVVAIDTYDNTLTVRPIESAGGAAPELTFMIDKKTEVTGCSQSKTREDIAVGEHVSVKYHEEGGILFADAVDIPAVVLACYQ